MLHEPRLMRVAVLTAALQNVVSREDQEVDPLGSSLESALWWIDQAGILGVDIQLSAALQVVDSHVPPEAMLDPVAAHLPVRTMSATEGVDLSDGHLATIIAACETQKVRICDLGYFDDLLHKDEGIRRKIHAHLMRCARAAAKLSTVGCGGVTTFIGRHTGLDMDQNVALFETEVIPILKQFRAMGLTLWIEQCPMPGWNTTDVFVNNIAHCAGMWIKLIRIAEKHDVDSALRITYDESHDILMGNTHHGSFAAMRAAGLGHVVNRFHGKQQYRNRALTALWTVMGKMIDNGCRVDGQPHPDPAKQGGAWNVMTCAHGMIGIGHYNPLNIIQGLEADWLDHQIAARTVLELDPRDTYFILEHEWGPNRVQEQRPVLEMIAFSSRFIRAIDAAAEAMVQAGVWARAEELPIPGTPNPAYDIPGLIEAALQIQA